MKPLVFVIFDCSIDDPNRDTDNKNDERPKGLYDFSLDVLSNIYDLFFSCWYIEVELTRRKEKYWSVLIWARQ